MEEGHVITGKYRIVRRIGVGGMGAVYEVERVTRGIHFRYALKQLRRELEENPDVTRRFIDEARRMVELLHPNIVRIIDIDDDPDFGTFILMEMINGPNLSQVIREQGRRPYSEVIRLGTEIGSALDFAHSKGVIHRDIKPQNILIEEGTGRAVLTDFGIAKKIRMEGEETDGTKTGFFIGTQRYASPQQMRNETPEPRWDIYSLGAVLYEAYSGRRYLEDMNENQIFGNVGFNPGWKPTLEFPVAPPPRFMQLIEQCLEKEREARVANASDLVRRLRECVNDAPPDIGTGAVPPPSPPPLPEEPETKKERYDARRGELRAQAEERLRLLDGLEAAAKAMGVTGEWTSTEAMRNSLVEIAELEKKEQFSEAMQRLEALCEHGTEVRRSIDTALNEAFTKAAGSIDARWAELKQRAGPFFPAAREQDLQRAADAARESMRSGLWGEASRRLADGRAVVDEAARVALATARQRVDAAMAEAQSRHATLQADYAEAAGRARVDLVALQRSVAAAVDEGKLADAVKQSEDANGALGAALETARRAAADTFTAQHAELERMVRRLDVEAARAAAPNEVARAREAQSTAEQAAKDHRYRQALEALAAATAAYREAEGRLVARRGEEGRRQQLAKQLGDVEGQLAAVDGLHEIARGLGVEGGGTTELARARETLSGLNEKAAGDQLDREIEKAARIADLLAKARAAAETGLRSALASNSASLRKAAAELAARAGRFLPKDADPAREIDAAERSASQGDWKAVATALAEARRRQTEGARGADRAAREAISSLLDEGGSIFESLTSAGHAAGVPQPKAVQAQVEKQLGDGNLGAAVEIAEAYGQDLRQVADRLTREEAEQTAAARATVEHFLERADVKALRAAAADEVTRAEKARAEGDKAERARRHREAAAAYRESHAAYEEAERRLVAEQEKRIQALRGQIESALNAAASVPAPAVEEGIAAAKAALALIGKEDRGRVLTQLESARGLLESQVKEGPACAEAIGKRDEASALQAKLAQVFNEGERREVLELTSNAAAAFKRRAWSQARDGFAAATAAWSKLEREAAERIRIAEELARKLAEKKKELAAIVARARQAPEPLVGEARAAAEKVAGAGDASLADVERAAAALEAALAEEPVFRPADEQRTRAKALEARVVEEGFKPRALKGARRLMAEADGTFAKRSWKEAGEQYAETFRVLRELEKAPPPAPAVSLQTILAAAAGLIVVAGGAVYYVTSTPTPTPTPISEPTIVKPQPTIVKPQPTIAKPEPTIAKPEPTIAQPPPKAAPYLASLSPDPSKAVVVKENATAAFSVDVKGLEGSAAAPIQWLLDGKLVAEARGSREYEYKPDFSAAREKPYTVEARLEGGQEGKSAATWNVEVEDVNRSPEIVRSSPSQRGPVTAKAGDKMKFSVEAKDADGDTPTYAWKVDGKPAGKNAASFELAAAEGQKRVTVDVGDGKGEAPSVVGWDLALLEVPTPAAPVLAFRASPKSPTTIDFNASQVFKLDPSGALPSGVNYEWTVDGEKAGSDASFRFRPDQPSYVRKAPVRIAAVARAGSAKPFSYEWTVKVTPPAPKLTSSSPSASELEGGSAQNFEVNAAAPIGDQKLTYVFEVDGRESQKSDRPSFRYDPSDNREHRIASRVIDNYGNASERKTWRMRAAVPPPEPAAAAGVTDLVQGWLTQYRAAFNGKDVNTLASLLKLDASKKGALEKSLSIKRDLRVVLQDIQIQKLGSGGATASYKQTESFVDPTGQTRELTTSMKQNFRVVGGRVELEK